jgi:hypothetical protein
MLSADTTERMSAAKPNHEARRRRRLVGAPKHCGLWAPDN